ncbi:MAG: hypothetical protein JJE46_09880 [Acidimicrobiia bacterium]|nr:hypothetical protein [Acidimicrobiia bacterium]
MTVSAIAWIVIGVLTLALLGAVMGWILNSGARRDLAAALAAEQAAHTETAQRGEHLENRMRTLRNELTEAHQTNAELTQRVGRANPTDGRFLGLWALERHRQARVAGTPLLGVAIGPGVDLTSALSEAIRVELEVLREDVGTHGELGDVDLGEDLTPSAALTILRVVQELTAVFAKRADELEVTLGHDDDADLVTVAALGWTDPTPNVSAFEAGVAALDATLEIRPDPERADTALAIVRLGPPHDG